MYVSSSSSGTPNLDPECSFYNETLCPNGVCPKEVVKCSTESPNNVGQLNFCYTVWQNNSEGIVIKLKGCISGADYGCVDSSKCIERTRYPKKGHFFCCCQSDLCNKEFYHIPEEEIELSPPQPTTSDNFDLSFLWIAIYIVIPILLILLVTLVFSWYRRNKSRTFNDDLCEGDETVPINDQSLYRFKNIELVEEMSKGRFGTVWKARLPNENGYIGDKWVAVKIFPAHEKNSWLTEQQVFMLPQFEHENILPFLGFEKKENVPYPTEYWIISEYHELGSLSDYLKGHTIDFNGLLKISEGISRGLAHLHDEIPATKVAASKPAIVHRDFKSRNVLLKSDLSPRIADFGLCLIFYPDRSPNGLGQVGTRRYMAPEVLDGAIIFSRDSLIRIDMYACGLVLWEILSQCRGEDDTLIPDNYMLPFEEEVGHNPSLEDMQETVCQAKKRPEIKPIWRNYPFTSMICETIEDCWDQDAEARLSASCVLERISHIIKTRSSIIT